jgi:two-component system OmpR family sensor kinase
MAALGARVPRRLLPRARLLPRTLRGRLIAGLMALLAVACAVVGLVTYLAVQKSLSSELNSQLQTATSLAYNCWRSEDGDNPAAKPATGPSPATEAKPDPDSSAAASEGSTASGAKASTSAGTDMDASTTAMFSCQGLGEDTFVAYIASDEWKCELIPLSKVTLTAADKQTLLSITPVTAVPPGNGSADSTPVRTTTRYLSWAKGTYELTAVRAPDGDGTYITGLSLSSMHNLLTDMALAEAAVFSAVLVFAGVLGTLWVRFSLRPLRRVAATASQVAELPLETGEVSLPAGVPDTDPATETGQVGLAFNRMLGHVEATLKRRAASEARLRRFAADASHELRTPLAAIRGYAELALLRPGEAPEEVTHALGRVLSESRRMSTLVDDLLLLARLDAGRPLRRDPVDMTRLAIDATSDAQVARPGHRWILELPDDPVSALGDEDRLRQVLGNLVTNAGRHTPDGTSVTVRLCDQLPDGEPAPGSTGQASTDQASTVHGSTVHGSTVQRGSLPPEPRLVISVTDDGLGIQPDLLPELFERFTRADTSRSHAGGASSTGLGLAIVDAVVAAHHGAVLVTSRPGMTRFTIVLARLATNA